MGDYSSDWLWLASPLAPLPVRSESSPQASLVVTVISVKWARVLDSLSPWFFPLKLPYCYHCLELFRNWSYIVTISLNLQWDIIHEITRLFFLLEEEEELRGNYLVSHTLLEINCNLLKKSHSFAVSIFHVSSEAIINTLPFNTIHPK